MKLTSQIVLTLKTLPAAGRLAPLALALPIGAEAVQHIVEWNLGMFESRAAFESLKADSTRMSFGVIKAISVFVAVYFVAKALTKELGPEPSSGSFGKDFARNLWDPSGDLLGLLGMLLVIAPLILVHYGFNYSAFSTSIGPFLLLLDSVLVGLIALAMGASFWAFSAMTADLASN